MLLPGGILLRLGAGGTSLLTGPCSGSCVLAPGAAAASPGPRRGKVAACFALSGNFVAPCGAKVAASHAERKRGGRRGGGKGGGREVNKASRQI